MFGISASKSGILKSDISGYNCMSGNREPECTKPGSRLKLSGAIGSGGARSVGDRSTGNWSRDSISTGMSFARTNSQKLSSSSADGVAIPERKLKFSWELVVGVSIAICCNLRTDA